MVNNFLPTLPTGSRGHFILTGEQRSWRDDQTHEDTNYIENNFILREGFKEKRSKRGNKNQTLF